jgi:hypothetical protein
MRLLKHVHGLLLQVFKSLPRGDWGDSATSARTLRERTLTQVCQEQKCRANLASMRSAVRQERVGPDAWGNMPG